MRAGGDRCHLLQQRGDSTLIAGCLAGHFSLLQAACGYGVLALLGCVAIFLLVRRAEAMRTPVNNFFSHAHFLIDLKLT
ncbi:MAG: hypothetical protein CMK96_13140 [Pseudomonas sp.]|jgi:hypothetical protein|nr:hypothetical protein [Pseudomonas sp.]MAK87835.1 hypothetical protein [Pseudomonas sp.]HCH76510.1 hypothetical protein [Pseudomonas sp.]|tara:strand:- start:296 stop:532 length:237 start_codon:yes stop_codon:yes gene_type:complete